MDSSDTPRGAPAGSREMRHGALLARLVETHEDWLITRILGYAKEHGYTPYTSTLHEAWRESIEGLSKSLCDALASCPYIPELSPDEDFENDAIAAFGVLEAKRHRERGVRLDMFLGLMKYYRQAYVDVVGELDAGAEAREECCLFVHRFFDRVELGFLSEWVRLGRGSADEELQATNRRLTNEKNWYLTVFESLSDPVFLLDGEGRIANANHAAVELFLGPLSPGSVYYGEVEIPVAGWLRTALGEWSAGGARDSEFRLEIDTLIGRRCFSGKLARMLDISEKFPGTTVILSDITEREQDRRALQEARDNLEGRVRERTRELEEANTLLRTEMEVREEVEAEKQRVQQQLLHSQKMQAIGTLAGGVAHDLNNLLQVIIGNCSLVEMAEPRDADVMERVEGIELAAQRASALVRQLLLFSRRKPLERRNIDLNETVTELLRLLGRLLGEKIHVETDLEADLAPMLGDPGSVEQVITNLIVNARDAMPAGGTVTIRTRNAQFEDGGPLYPGAKPGAYVVLSVDDTGYGMDKETLARIFEPFFTTKEEGKGTGLGLSVVYGIVEKHGGWISAYSEPGEGASFRAHFPASSLADVGDIEAPRPLTELRGLGERLLVVEDEQGVREFMRLALSGAGYEVRTASSAEDAIMTVAAGELPDALVSDVVLPGANGPALVSALREHRPALPALLVSGYMGGSAEDEDGRELPRLAKPFSLRQLLRAVREILPPARA